MDITGITLALCSWAAATTLLILHIIKQYKENESKRKS